MEKEPMEINDDNDFSTINMAEQRIIEEEMDERAVPQSPVKDFDLDVPFSSKDKNDRTNEIAFQDQESTAKEEEQIYENVVQPTSRSGKIKATSNAVGGMNITQKGSKLEVILCMLLTKLFY